jgi:hypothetical protein
MNIREHEVIGQVRQALSHDARLGTPHITITFLGDAVSLAGVVDTPEAVTRAGAIAQRAVPGIAIDNGLTVGPSHDHEPADPAYAKRMKVMPKRTNHTMDTAVVPALTRAFGEAELPVYNLRPIFAHGVLTLDGELDSPDQHEMALYVAHATTEKVWKQPYTLIDNLKVIDRRGQPPTPESKLVKGRRAHPGNSPVIPLEPGGVAPQNKARHTRPIEER